MVVFEIEDKIRTLSSVASIQYLGQSMMPDIDGSGG
jgi:hypothetical protein